MAVLWLFCTMVMAFNLKENSLSYPWWVGNLPPIRSPEGMHFNLIHIPVLDCFSSLLLNPLLLVVFDNDFSHCAVVPEEIVICTVYYR